MPISAYNWVLGSSIDSAIGSTSKAPDLRDINYGYKYPKKLSLKPGTEQHDRLKDAILNRAINARGCIQSRFDSWNIMDQMLTAYIPLSEHEKGVQAADSRKPVSIVIPVAFAVRETLMSYMTSVLLAPPYFRYAGTGPEDSIKAILMEKIIQNQCDHFKTALSLHTQLQDSFTYGIGISTPRWAEDYSYKRRKFDTYYYNQDGDLATRQVVDRQRVLSYEGNVVDSIDPYMYLPDPNVAVHQVQKMEFVGWVHRTSYTSLLGQEVDSGGHIFNVKYIQHIDGRSALYESDPSNRNKDEVPKIYDSTLRPADVVYMYVTLIPKEWKLGGKETPEKWLFALAGDSIIIMAEPHRTDHDSYPVTVAAPDYDGYSPFPLSRLEVSFGLQQTINWFMSTHIAEVRKAIHDVLIVDPELVDMRDVLNPHPGKVIRLRRSAYGKGVEGAMTQLKINDVTRGHVTDSMLMLDLLNRVTGAVDNLQGVPRASSERVSATEASDVNRGAVGKMARLARIISEQAWKDLAYMHGKHTQQFATLPSYVDVSTGQWADVLMKTFGTTQVQLSPDDLDFDYDIVSQHSGLPTTSDAQILLQLYQLGASDPEIRQNVSMVNLFMELARISGYDNMRDFLRQQGVAPQTMGMEDIQSGVDKGNLVPMGKFAR